MRVTTGWSAWSTDGTHVTCHASTALVGGWYEPAPGIRAVYLSFRCKSFPQEAKTLSFLSGKVRAPSGRARWFPGCWERNSSEGRGGGRGVGLRMPVFRHNDRLSDILILGNLKGLVNAFNSESAVVCYPALVPGTFRPRKRFRASPSGIPGTGHDEQCTRQMALS
jgi:hypothetical protein